MLKNLPTTKKTKQNQEVQWEVGHSSTVQNINFEEMLWVNLRKVMREKPTQSQSAAGGIGEKFPNKNWKSQLKVFTS